MTRRKIKEKNIRKLTRMGNKSLGFTVPLEILQKLGWREKQKIVVKKRGKGLIVKDWEK